jgi:hypothetical protein
MDERGDEQPDRGALVHQLHRPVRLDVAGHRAVAGLEAAGDRAGQVPGAVAHERGPDRAVGGVAVYQRDAPASGIRRGHLPWRRVPRSGQRDEALAPVREAHRPDAGLLDK